eukprot:gene3966-14047_t
MSKPSEHSIVAISSVACSPTQKSPREGRSPRDGVRRNPLQALVDVVSPTSRKRADREKPSSALSQSGCTVDSGQMSALVDGLAQLSAQDAAKRSADFKSADAEAVQKLEAKLEETTKKLKLTQQEVLSLKEEATQDHLMKPTVARKLNEKIRQLESELKSLRANPHATVDNRVYSGVVYTLKSGLLDMEKRFHGCIYAFPDVEDLWVRLLEEVGSTEASSDLLRLQTKRYDATVASLVVGTDGSYVGGHDARSVVDKPEAHVGRRKGHEG